MSANLGDRVRDRVTGFEGIVVARTTWLHGCVRLTVQPSGLDKDGKIQTAEGFDELQIEILGRGVVPATPEQVRPKMTGGPRPEPAKRR